MPKLDDMSWHLASGEFPPDFPEERAATHIGLFVAWAIHKGFWATSPGTDDSVAIQRVRDRTGTGRTFLIEHCDGKLFTGMLNKEGISFAQKYYGNPPGKPKTAEVEFSRKEVLHEEIKIF